MIATDNTNNLTLPNVTHTLKSPFNKNNFNVI